MARLTPKERRSQILREAEKLARELGSVYHRDFTRGAIAERCGCSGPLVTFYFKNGMAGLREELG